MGLLSIKMPDVGEGITEAEIVEWNVAPGDLVREDDVLGAVMTDKATVEIPSPVDGKVVSIEGVVGEMTAVGAAIISIETAGDGSAADAEATPVEAQQAAPEAVPEPAPPPKVPAPSHEGRSPIQPGALGPPRPPGEKPLAAPSVRRRAMDAGVPLAFVRGTGPAGRILHGDLDSYLSGYVAPATATRAPDSSVTETKVIGLRRRIAERLQDAKQRIPHITYVDEVDVTEVENLRARLNHDRSAERAKLTLLPFIMLAMTRAVKAHPKLNAHFADADGVIRQFGAVHIGMAVQTPTGLVVAVLRHAETRDIWDLAAESQRLATAARDGSITREELSGSTITLTSLGPLGGIVFHAGHQQSGSGDRRRQQDRCTAGL